ncbi:MAG: DUF4010 domain-containing protein [Gammaproteobacteria bacterium]|nr:DUF4010 domain-containing protein [Gammaproteobacteria bacterium]MDH5800882.1 DUF4010 domain-containing protein [Gammaproteobacteria bacterium]
MDQLISLGIALALGLLVGLERGWQEREAAEGSRIAGIRTFGLIGLLGGLWALLAGNSQYSDITLGFAFVGLAIILIVAHTVDRGSQRNYGVTTIIAALITFVLGILTVLGEKNVAVAAAVATTVLLSLKPVLHQWIQKIEILELTAALKLLLISVVLLPVLPDKGFGPWEALNPYEIWWMVVLIASISFISYVSMKLFGAHHGLLLTGFLGGIASSTAVTLNYSHMARTLNIHRVLAAGILIASATMFPRVLLEIAVINHEMIPLTATPLLAMTTVNVLGAFWLWRHQPDTLSPQELARSKPFELLPALRFGLLLVIIMLLAQAFKHWLGDTGIYVLAAFSGIADVDAITLSLARMARNGLADEIAANAIIIATIVNSAVKTALVYFIGGMPLFRYVIWVFLLILAVGTGLAVM